MELIGRTLLIADDNADDRFFIRKALERVAPAVIAQYVESGEEAVAYLRGHGAYGDRARFPYPSFVITDLEMARGDGFSVLQELHQSHGVPVMMLSSSGRPSDARRAYSLGAALYCLKPAGRSALCVLLNTFFNGQVSSEMPSGATDVRIVFDSGVPA